MGGDVLYQGLSVYSNAMLPVVIIVVLALAVARMVVLLVNDKITEPVRASILGWFGPDSMITYGWNCPWCQGVWWSAIFTGLTYYLHPVPLTPGNVWLGILTGLGVAWVASFLADR